MYLDIRTCTVSGILFDNTLPVYWAQFLFHIIAVSCCGLVVVVGLLHGDMSQVERNEVITAFKHKSTPILAATDVAGMTHYQLTLVLS